MSSARHVRKSSDLRLAVLGLAAVLALAFGSTLAEAQQTFYWCGGTGNWSDASNWGGTEPNQFDTVYIINGGTATVRSPDEIYQNIVYLGGSNTGHPNNRRAAIYLLRVCGR